MTEPVSDMEEGTPAAEQRAASEEPALGSAPSPQVQITGFDAEGHEGSCATGNMGNASDRRHG